MSGSRHPTSIQPGSLLTPHLIPFATARTVSGHTPQAPLWVGRHIFTTSPQRASKQYSRELRGAFLKSQPLMYNLRNHRLVMPGVFPRTAFALVLMIGPLRANNRPRADSPAPVSRMARVRSFISPLGIFFNWHSDVSLGLPARILSATISSIGAVVSWPIITLYGSLVYRGNAKLRLRRFDSSWNFFLLLSAFVLSYFHYAVAGCTLSALVILVEMEGLASIMHVRRGVVMLFLYDESLGRISLDSEKSFSCYPWIRFPASCYLHA